MITSITSNADAQEYSLLYERVSELLRTHTDTGLGVPYGHKDAVKPMDPMVEEVHIGDFDGIKEEYSIVEHINSVVYKPNKFYIQVDADTFFLCNEPLYRSDITYFSKKEVKYIKQPEEDAVYFVLANGDYSLIDTEDIKAPMTVYKALVTETNYEGSKYYVKTPRENKYALCDSPDFKAGIVYYSSDNITSLEELFSYMKDINMIAPRYTRLSLTEPLFVIDANARTITIPSEFIKNGVSVKGDQVAETLWFKIHRYFDTTDLSLQNIYIQWRTPRDDNGEISEGVSIPRVMDIESEPGYILFDWPLTDLVTAASGNVQFSVRFYNYSEAEGKLKYSLSTLTHTVPIKPGLDYSMADIIQADDIVVDDARALINDRFQNSPLYGNGSSSAETPIFLEGFELPERLCLDTDAAGFKTKNVDLNIQAFTNDAGQISYYWRKYDFDKNRLPLSYEIKYIETKDETRQPNKMYYIQHPDNSLTLLDPAMDITDATVEGTVVERVSYAVADSIGLYYAVATNRVRNATEECRTPMDTFDEHGAVINHYCVVPAPLPPELLDEEDAQLPEKIVLSGTNLSASLTEKTKIVDEGKATWLWEYSLDGETFDTLKDADGNDVEDEVLEIASAVQMGDVIVDENGTVIQAPVGIDLTKRVDGYYRVHTINNLNKETDGVTRAQAEIVSHVCRVSYPATKPFVTNVTIDEDGRYEFGLTEITRLNGLKVKVTIPDTYGENEMRTDDDSIEYQWYRYLAASDDEEGFESDKNNALSGAYVPDNDIALTEDKYLVRGAQTDKFIPDEPGYYYCWVTNHFNGNTASRCSKFLNITSI